VTGASETGLSVCLSLSRPRSRLTFHTGNHLSISRARNPRSISGALHAASARTILRFRIPSANDRAAASDDARGLYDARKIPRGLALKSENTPSPGASRTFALRVARNRDSSTGRFDSIRFDWRIPAAAGERSGEASDVRERENCARPRGQGDITNERVGANEFVNSTAITVRFNARSYATAGTLSRMR